jgi:CheY-like chemotaxis protein
VLLVEDDATYIEMFSRQAGPGVRLNVVADGRAAWALLDAAQRHDVAFVDLRLPPTGPTGVEVIHRLHRDDPDCRVVACTSWPDTEDLREALRSGIVGAVLKTGDYSEIHDVFRHYRLAPRT